GGAAFVFGADTSATIGAGGSMTVEKGGVASGTTVSAGGLTVLSGGKTLRALVAGGSVAVSSGGVASATTISAGVVEVTSGGSLGTGALTFAGGGELRLDAATIGGTIGGFGIPDEIDMLAISYAANPVLSFTESASHTSGTLTVSAGGRSARLTLLGQYVTSQFAMADDGTGGTLITD